MIDPYKLFGSDRVYGTNGDGKAYIVCPAPHSKSNEPNAVFNMYTGDYYCFGECNVVCKTLNDTKRFLDNVGLSYFVAQISKQEKLIKESKWKNYLSLPLALDNDYLINKRHINNNIIKEYKLKANKDCVVCPIVNAYGDSVGVNIRWFSRKPKYIKLGITQQFLRMDLLNKYKPDDPLLLCEGMFGEMNLRMLGYNALSVLGNNINKHLPMYLAKYSNIYVCFDKDEAGIKMSNRVKSLISTVNILEGNEYDEVTEVKF